MPIDPQLNNGVDGLEPESEPAEPSNILGKNQKWAAAGLAVFAFFVVVLWFVQLKNNIYAPLNSTANTAEQAQIDSQTASDLALKNKDTDGDGINDYDELKLYKTSPYLADSDSDGLQDSAEIKGGTDPNCPQGRTCSGTGDLSAGAADAAAAPPASSSDALNNLQSQSAALNDILNQSDAGAAEDLTAEQKQLLETMDAMSLRQLLLEAGMPQADLDKISDADLMRSYSEILNSQ